MANQGNKHPGAGKDKKNKNQPSRSNPGNNNPGNHKGEHKESDFDPNSPEKRIQIDDNPEGTKKKIPH